MDLHNMVNKTIDESYSSTSVAVADFARPESFTANIDRWTSFEFIIIFALLVLICIVIGCTIRIRLKVSRQSKELAEMVDRSSGSSNSAVSTVSTCTRLKRPDNVSIEKTSTPIPGYRHDSHSSHQSYQSSTGSQGFEWSPRSVSIP